MNRVQAEYFIRVWMSTTTMQEAAEQLGLSERKVSNHAANLRRRGIPLPKNKEYKLPRNTGQNQLKEPDKKYLRELIKELEQRNEIERGRIEADKYRRGA